MILLDIRKTQINQEAQPMNNPTAAITSNAVRTVIDTALAAARGVVPGATFIGAFGEADKAGYARDSLEFDLFVSLFLNHIPGHITTDERGIVIRVG
jgi:hypothetical protein